MKDHVQWRGETSERRMLQAPSEVARKARATERKGHLRQFWRQMVGDIRDGK